MSSRTYLSIGDVLTLLREEFPDVTISKIRFLESQGLVNPERSPSGYRKFFEPDVERLRWVLRQQREHFLPLKVIRDRLADGDLDDTGRDGENGKAVEAGTRDGAAAAAAVGAGLDDEQPTKADEEAMARILADASRRAAAMPEAAQARRGLQVLGEGAPPASATDESTPGAATVTPAEPAGAAAATPPGSPAPPPPAAPASGPPSHGSGPRHAAPSAPSSSPSPSSAAPASAAPSSGPVASAAKGTGRANGAPQAGRGEPSPPVAEAAAKSEDPPARRGGAKGGGGAGETPATAIVTGASLTSEELCAASGLSREEVVSLQGFGLICPIVVAGMETYDEEALTVANLAAAFRAFGIEARHLRLYRNAADRELGLIEQVVIPLLRQRNPESRQRATEAADQLAALGQSMRASLLRQALHQHFGG